MWVYLERDDTGLLGQGQAERRRSCGSWYITPSSMNCAAAANGEAFNAVRTGLLHLITAAEIANTEVHHHNCSNLMLPLTEQQLALTCILAAFTSDNLSPLQLPPAPLSTDSASVAMPMEPPPSTAASCPYSAV